MLGADFGIIVGIIICVMFSAFFSASETAFTTLNRIRLKTEAEAGDSRAALVLSIAENYDKMLSTILIGNNIVNNRQCFSGDRLYLPMCWVMPGCLCPRRL